MRVHNTPLRRSGYSSCPLHCKSESGVCRSSCRCPVRQVPCLYALHALRPVAFCRQPLRPRLRSHPQAPNSESSLPPMRGPTAPRTPLLMPHSSTATACASWSPTTHPASAPHSHPPSPHPARRPPRTAACPFPPSTSARWTQGYDPYLTPARFSFRPLLIHPHTHRP